MMEDMEQKEQNRIIRMIAAKVTGKDLSPEEEGVLQEWLAEREEHREVYERVKQGDGVRELLRLQRAGYGERMARDFSCRLQKMRRRHRIGMACKWAGGVAAGVAVICCVWLLYQPKEAPLHLAVQEEIVPGSGKAVLTLANGAQIDVLRMEEGRDGKVLIDVKGQEVEEPDESGAADETVWHTLTVPAGGEFFYELSDSTKVWLNSASELRFPVHFAGQGTREVYLKGEAFFDVTKTNGAVPFVVRLSGGDIKVYGTRFLVKNYAGEPLSAVLTRGCIGFTSSQGRDVLLSPSDRLEVSGENMRIEQVDTTLYMSWINQMFVFDGQPLEEIMKTLSRWYDMEFTFQSEDLKHIRFSGRLNRYQDIRVLLRTYEQTAGIRFDIQGRNIIISRDS